MKPSPQADLGNRPWRSVEIAPPSLREETFNVLRVAAVIVCGAWIYLAATAPREAPRTPAADAAGQAAAGLARSGRGRSMPGERDLMPYQRLFRTLSGDDQRMFRELQEGLLEAENGRSASGRWPAVADLAARGIPPFAAIQHGPRGRYLWSFRQEGVYINYLGIAAAGREQPAFLLLMQEPDPQAPPDTTLYLPGDEQHHRLADGKVLHVSTWTRLAPTAPSAEGVISVPYADGWTQLLAGSGTP
ncbi:MAG TPA: hypothetical protein VHR45_13005 [Thermoanaerobaculia bacterium]|nr:hypothetical protein [Thermoanaerobaculia bacterium]